MVSGLFQSEDSWFQKILVQRRSKLCSVSLQINSLNDTPYEEPPATAFPDIPLTTVVMVAQRERMKPNLTRKKSMAQVVLLLFICVH